MANSSVQSQVMWLEIAWKGRVWNVKRFECHSKKFGFTLSIMDDYQALINGKGIKNYRNNYRKYR